jgi:hypothetical protein
VKWLASKRIAIKSIVLPGNFAATKAAARIAELATSIRESDGPIQPPVVEASTMRLISGHDRIAALLTLREKHVEVRMWEGSEQERRIMQIDENLFRRNDDRTALIAERVRLEAGEIIQSASDEAGTSVPPMQSVKSEARKKVAAKAGIKPASVKKAEQRAAAAEVEKEEQPAPAVAPLPDGFNAFGLPVSTEHRERVAALAAQLAAWERMTTALLTELARVEKIANPPLLSHQAVESIRDKARALGHVVREAIPTSLCFYCKNDDRAVCDCPACGATGLVGRHAGDNVPPELKTSGQAARIALDGRFILASSPEGMPPAPKAAAPKKRGGVRVVAVDETGAETDVPLDSEDDGEELAF